MSGVLWRAETISRGGRGACGGRGKVSWDIVISPYALLKCRRPLSEATYSCIYTRLIWEGASRGWR